MRLFIAIGLGEDLREKLAEVSAGLARRLRGVAWVRPENIHLTLKFLGEVSEGDVPSLREILDETASHHRPFALRAGGLGAFPGPSRPRVIWAGLSGELESLSRLVREIEEELSALGFPAEERPYHPHLTLGRVKNQSGTGDLEKVFSQARAESLGPLSAAVLLLMKSTLTPDGALHELVSEHRLTGDPRR
jgi:2'-5' RNA ligase